MERVLRLLEEIRPEFDFNESKDFIEDGYLDSFDITTLVSMLEEEFECIIDGMDVQAEYFISIEAIVDLVKKNGGNI